MFKEFFISAHHILDLFCTNFGRMGCTKDKLVLFFPPESWDNRQPRYENLSEIRGLLTVWHGMHSNFIKKVSKNRPAVTKGPYITWGFTVQIFFLLFYVFIYLFIFMYSTVCTLHPISWYDQQPDRRGGGGNIKQIKSINHLCSLFPPFSDEMFQIIPPHEGE